MLVFSFIYLWKLIIIFPYCCSVNVHKKNIYIEMKMKHFPGMNYPKIDFYQPSNQQASQQTIPIKYGKIYYIVWSRQKRITYLDVYMILYPIYLVTICYKFISLKLTRLQLILFSPIQMEKIKWWSNICNVY